MGYRSALKKIRKVYRSAALWLSRWQQWRLYNSITKNAPVIARDIHGTRFVLYPSDRYHARSLLSPPTGGDFKVMSSLIHPGDVIFDVGAHIGKYSVFASRLCQPGGRVFSFEPVPESYWRLCETLSLNRCKDVVPIQKLLCDKVERVQMNLFEEPYSSWNTMGWPRMPTPDGEFQSPKTSIVVQSDTLDHFCRENDIHSILFLKVDVEGFEKLVFSGSTGLLGERRIDYICFELSQDPLRGSGITAREVFESLELHGYLAYRFDENNGTFHGPVHDSSEYWANYFASWKDLTILELPKKNGRGGKLS